VPRAPNGDRPVGHCQIRDAGAGVRSAGKLVRRLLGATLILDGKA
jgi:hypothetical protein